MAKIKTGLVKLGSNLEPVFDSETGKGMKEFSQLACDCCNSRLYGSRHEFAILG